MRVKFSKIAFLTEEYPEDDCRDIHFSILLIYIFPTVVSKYFIVQSMYPVVPVVPVGCVGCVGCGGAWLPPPVPTNKIWYSQQQSSISIVFSAV